MITEIPVNEGWQYQVGFTKDCLENDYAFSEAVNVSLPHNMIACGEDYFDERACNRLGTYTRELTVPERYNGKRLLLRFEGVLSYVEVYVNGIFVTSHKGEAPFVADITAPVRYTEKNRIVLKVDATIRKDVPCPGVRGPLVAFGGIFRDVVFCICDGRDIKDVVLRFNPADTSIAAIVSLYDWYPDTELDGDILGEGGNVICSLSARSVQDSTVRLKGDGTELSKWSPETPTMYTALIRLKQAGRVLDCRYVPFGISDAKFTREGFFLNGEKRKLIGVLRADSYPVFGRSATELTERRDARLIKAAGCNAVRTMGLAGKDFIDECNKIGLMVIEDVYGDGYIGGADWRQAFLDNVSDMIVRDRNNPCIIGWGVRANNSRDCDELYFKANRVAKAADPTRATVGARCFTNGRLYEDVFAYCDYGGDFKRENKWFAPHMLGEHSGHAGAKPYDCEEVRLNQALSHAHALDCVMGSNSAGAFAMSFTDFAAPRGIGGGDSLNHCGIFDAFRNEKLSAAVYKSQGDEPMMTLSSDLSTGEYTGKLYAFTNADRVILYRNEEKVGEFYPDRKAFPHLKHPPVVIDDYCGALPSREVGEGFKLKLFKSVLRDADKKGLWNRGFWANKKAALLKLLLKIDDHNLGELLENYSRMPPQGVTYRFDGVFGEEVKCSRTISPALKCCVRVTASPEKKVLCTRSFERIAFTLSAEDTFGNRLPYAFFPVVVQASGSLAVEGSSVISLKGGTGGFYVRTVGNGAGTVTVQSEFGTSVYTYDVKYLDWETV